MHFVVSAVTACFIGLCIIHTLIFMTTAITACLLGATYHSLCAFITARLMICYCVICFVIS